MAIRIDKTQAQAPVWMQQQKPFSDASAMVLEMHKQLAPGISSPPVIRIRGVANRTDEYCPMRILETVERGQSYCGSSDSRAM